MANTAVTGTIYCSDGTEIALFNSAIAEGTESTLQTSVQNNFTVVASDIGTAFAGKQIVASSPIMGDGDGSTAASYAYLLRAGEIINIFSVGLTGIAQPAVVPLCTQTVLQAGDTVRVMMNTSTDRELSLACYTSSGRYHIFAVTPTGAATNELVSILTGQNIGDVFQNQTVVKAYCTGNDSVKLAPSGGGVYVVSDKNTIVGSIPAQRCITGPVSFTMCNWPIGLNFRAQGITSS